MRIRVWLAPLIFLLGVSCTSQPAATAMPPFQTTANMKDLMLNVLDPAADGIWEAVGTVITLEGTFEKAPSNADEWAVVRMHAIQLAESGNLLMLPGRTGGAADWVKHSEALVTHSRRALKAIDDRDKDALFTIGGDIYDVCTDCHKQFALQLAPRP